MCRSRPHHFVRDGPMSMPLSKAGGKYRAIGDPALVNRRVRTDDDVAHQGMDAVGADHRVGPRPRAVGE